jgi:membrane fusion protein, multidrug efflux system
VTDSVIERREVRTGRRRPGEVEIVEGLREQERVVVEGTQNVRDGTRVREQAQDAPEEQPSSS